MTELIFFWCAGNTLFLLYTIIAVLWFNRRQERWWDAHLERHRIDMEIEDLDVEEIGADRADT